MVKPCDRDDEWERRKEQIIGLGEHSFHKSYYPQLRQNLDRLERFRTLLDHTADFVLLVTVPEGKIIDANAAFGQLLHQPVDALIGHSFTALGFGQDAFRVLERLHREMLFHQRNTPARDHALITRFGNEQCFVWLELTFCLASLEGHNYGLMVGRDVTERKRNEEMLTTLLTEKAALQDNALVGIVNVREHMIVSCNRRFEEILGYGPGKLIGRSTRTLFEADEPFHNFDLEAARAFESGQQFSAKTLLLKAEGSAILCELTGRPLNLNHPEKGSIWMINDLNELKLAEEKALFLSHHDALTRLPNHQLLKDRLQQAIAFADKSRSVMALLVIDIDRFKTFNDSLGYGIGNELLISIARRLSEFVRETDTVSRQGGEEFLLFLPDLDSATSCVRFIDKLMRELAQPITLSGQEISLSASVGIALYPQDGADFETLLKKADMAMYRAKSGGRNTYRFFNEQMNEGAIEQLTLSVGLRKALDAAQFQLYYQPQIEIGSNRLIGAEALIRWCHPERGMIPPGQFIPVAESSGLIVAIGDWVLQEACREVARWQAAGMSQPLVAVNLSALQFAHGNIEKSVANAIHEAGIAPTMLELELTESIMMHDTENVLASVQRLKETGVSLSIDDFGTGYSSLSYLKRFAVDKLKIDQSFVRELLTDQSDATIVHAIIQMAHNLGLRTIAEGVETAAVLEQLQAYGCDEVQGYYLAKPMPADAFMVYLQQHIRIN